MNEVIKQDLTNAQYKKLAYEFAEGILGASLEFVESHKWIVEHDGKRVQLYISMDPDNSWIFDTYSEWDVDVTLNMSRTHDGTGGSFKKLYHS